MLHRHNLPRNKNIASLKCIASKFCTFYIYFWQMTLGSLNIRCLSTPCHTKGHICYLITSPGQTPVVFTGQSFFENGFTFFTGQSLGFINSYIQTKLFQIGFTGSVISESVQNVKQFGSWNLLAIFTNL